MNNQDGFYGRSGHMEAMLDASTVRSIDDLEQALQDMREQWFQFHEGMADAVFGEPLTWHNVYRCGSFRLRRFATGFEPKTENHIGEAIQREDGTIEYLSTYRLSAAQSRRAFLLSQLRPTTGTLRRPRRPCVSLKKTSWSASIRRDLVIC